MLEKLCYCLIGGLIILMGVVGYGQSQHKEALRIQAIQCQKYEKTSEYLSCLAPINAELKQIQEDEDDAAVNAALTSAIVTSTMVQP